MKFTILGSGGSISTPRPFCQCPMCYKARREGSPNKRNSSSLYINDIATLIEHSESEMFKSVKITTLGYQGNESNNYAYLIEENHKKVQYASCDTLHMA